MSADAPRASSASSADSTVARQYLAFDPGRRRVGVATGNTVTGRASPLMTLDTTGDRHFDAIARLLRDWRPDALVVGIPRHPDGTPHASTRLARRFAGELQRRFGLAVHPVDERYSSVEAERGLGDGAAPRAGGLDAAAAAVILDQFFGEPTAAMPTARPLRAADAAESPTTIAESPMPSDPSTAQSELAT